jgi:hypothetical protein
MNQMLLGAIALASIVAGQFFFSFWRRTRDRFFLLFALSFWAEGLSRVYTGLMETLLEDNPGTYLIRLLAYSLIILAIVDKNRPRRKS